MAPPLLDGSAWRLPEHGDACFDMLPATILDALDCPGLGAGNTLELGQLAGRYEHVLLVYFDAFGWRWYERHGDHPLLRHARDRGRVSKLTSQFPSTTAAHMTTIHTGAPVGMHGVYEWFTYLPKLNRIIAPLVFSFAGDTLPNTLLACGIAPGDVYPESEFYATLQEAGIEAHIGFPHEIAASTPTKMLLRHATVHAFGGIAEGVGAVGRALAAAERGYGFVYLPSVDAAMHRLGPDHGEVERMIDETLAALDQSLVRGEVPPGTLVLITADHGMAAIDPGLTHYVNELWPQLVEHLATGADGRPLAPAGSSRDLFLHARPERHEQVRETLEGVLEGHAEVLSVPDLVRAGLFGPAVGERLLERVGDLVVLPYPGEAVYWSEPPRFTQPYYGQHGGLSHAEMEIPLIAFVT